MERFPVFAVLMAGGSGTRLWPLSRPADPKQCLPLLGGRSLFDGTVERLGKILPLRDVFVVSNSVLEPHLRKAATGIPAENFFCEPSPRNTAPAVAYSLACLSARAPQFVMACLPADHFIADGSAYGKVFRAAAELAARGHLVTLGIEPTAPVTGYGYIEPGAALDPVDGFRAFRVKRFTEKPQTEEAREMVRRGGFTWNSGMFFWRSDVIADEYRRHQPETGAALDSLARAIGSGDRAAVAAVWEQFPALSLDYAILEKSDRVAVIPAGGLGWSDIGSWDALVELYRAHPELRGKPAEGRLDAGSKSVTVIRKPGTRRILATVGLEDVIIVETEDATLVCRGGRSQDVRKITAALPKDPPPAR
jgi:mannose-1-phosphate guanylyltransferase